MSDKFEDELNEMRIHREFMEQLVNAGVFEVNNDKQPTVEYVPSCWPGLLWPVVKDVWSPSYGVDLAEQRAKEL